MALFGRKTEEKKVEKPVAIAASTLVVSGGKNSETLRNPRIT
jgi:hypothetical protein